MARYAHARNNFLLGEVAPSSFARTDLEQYNQMCKSLENFTVLPAGGARKRLGTEYVANITSTHATPATAKVIPYKGATKNYFVIGSNTARLDLYDRTAGVTADHTIIASTGLTSTFDWTNATYTQYGALLVVTNGSNYPMVVYVDSTEDIKAF